MNFRKVWVVTKSLLLSQLRATAVGRTNFRSFIRRPMVLGILDLVVMIAAAVLSYLAANAVVGTPYYATVLPLIKNVVVILPAVIMGIILLMGLVLEVSSGAQFASSDTVNWLPVTASEYVSASALSLLLYYSVIPIAALSATFSFSFVFGLSSAWILAAFLSIFCVVVSSSVLEVLRAVLNRFSSSFYKRGGRAAILLRIVSSILILVIFQSLFYPSVYEHFLGVITPNPGATWYVPILWASVSVTSLINGNLETAALFALLTIVLSLVLFSIAIFARSKYWVPTQPTITISSATYSPKTSLASVIFDQVQLAITKKDVRGLLRRRELVRLLAMPFVFLAISFLSPGAMGFSFTLYFGFFIVALPTLFIAIAGIGSEGRAIINLYQTPVNRKDLVIGKSLTPVIFGSIFAVLIYVIVAIFTRVQPSQVIIFFLAAIGIAFEMSFLGTLIGLRFPNFSESPRAQFISQSGSLIAVPAAAIVGGLSLSPLLFTSIFGYDYYYRMLGFVGSIGIILVASYFCFRFAEAQAGKLLSQLPI